MTHIITRRTEEELRAWTATEWGFIAGFMRWDGEPLRLENYQRDFLRDRSRFRWAVKARQTGFSFVFALEALARCHLVEGHTAIFVSYNQSDAMEKILVARQLYEELPTALQKRLVTDTKTELAFESNGRGKRISRIISVPSKPPRGKRGSVYLDELAHYLDGRAVYTGSTALILRSGGQLSAASTPLGRRGVFWEIAEEELRRYPHHSRQAVPWYACRFFTTDVNRAEREAPAMDTESRVRAFGTDAIIEQFDSLELGDFQQEFECAWLAEGMSYFPYELILPCTDDQLSVRSDIADIPCPKGRLVAGFDVGRTRDRSELAVFEQLDDRFVCRLLRSYDQVPFAIQEGDLRELLETLPVARLSIDKSGIGMHLAENLARDYPQVVGEVFTNDTKERWATNFKIILQRRDVVLPRNREVIAQIHSIKRQVLPSGKVSFDAERTGRGHADRFWAIALACQKERVSGASRGAEIGVRVIG